MLVSFVVSGGGSVLILCIRVPSHSFSTFLALGYLLSVGFGSVGSVDSSSPFSLRCYAPQTFSVVLAHLADLLRSRLEDDTLTATLERLDPVLSFLCHYSVLYPRQNCQDKSPEIQDGRSEDRDSDT